VHFLLSRFPKGCPKRVALAPRNLLKACGANGFGISFCFPLASFGQDPDTFPIPRQFTMENTIFAIFAYLFISLWLPRSLHDSLLLLLANQKIGRKPRSKGRGSDGGGAGGRICWRCILCLSAVPVIPSWCSKLISIGYGEVRLKINVTC